MTMQMHLMTDKTEPLNKSAAPTNVGTPSHTLKATLSKQDKELQIVWGEVYVPDVLDSQGDFASAQEIMNMAYGFLSKGITDSIDINHDGEKCGACVVESFIARENDPDFILVSWVVGVHVPDTDQWNLIKSRELNGFSMEGTGFKTRQTVQFNVPEILKGETLVDAADTHHHEFYVNYGPSGEFLGGYTDTVDGHYHKNRQASNYHPPNLRRPESHIGALPDTIDRLRC